MCDDGVFFLPPRVAGKDKRIVHLEEKVADLKETRSRRVEAVSSKNHPLSVYNLCMVVSL